MAIHLKNQQKTTPKVGDVVRERAQEQKKTVIVSNDEDIENISDSLSKTTGKIKLRKENYHDTHCRKSYSTGLIVALVLTILLAIGGSIGSYYLGYAKGWEESHDTWYNEGHSEGYSQGRAHGYQAGVTDHINDFYDGKKAGWTEGAAAVAKCVQYRICEQNPY